VATRPHLDSVLSFGDALPPPAGDEPAASDAGSDYDEGEFEFFTAAHALSRSRHPYLRPSPCATFPQQVA